MGAWGSGSFENDSAMDYIDQLADAPSGLGEEDAPGKLSLIVGCLVSVTASDDDDADDQPTDLAADLDDDDDALEVLEELDVDVCAAAIVAAEIVAAVGGHPHAEFLTRDEADDDDAVAQMASWSRKTGKDQSILGGKQVREMALAAIDRVLLDEGSEARGLWAESDHFEQWQQAMHNLRARLEATLK
jgi:hypothetical protein